MISCNGKAAGGSQNGNQSAKAGKNLIVYFSHSGMTYSPADSST